MGTPRSALECQATLGLEWGDRLVAPLTADLFAKSYLAVAGATFLSSSAINSSFFALK